jgi:hypothetical protein
VKLAIAAIVLCLAAGVTYSETTVTINGRTIQSAGSSIVITNDTMVVDGLGRSGQVIQGSGKSATENRDLNDFTELRLDISANVTVTPGERAKCTITADDNILPLILTEHFGKVLRITAAESYSSRQGVKIAVEVPLLVKARVNGSGAISIAGATAEELALVINGSGDIHADGQVTELRARINGSGNVYAAGLLAKKVMVVLNGSGDADVHVVSDLTIKLNGSGGVSYSGTPSTVNSSLNGSGRIQKR